MRKLILLAALTSVAITGCGPAPHKTKHAKSRVVAQQVYHFKDGRSGYQAGNTWYYWIPSDTGEVYSDGGGRSSTSRSSAGTSSSSTSGVSTTSTTAAPTSGPVASAPVAVSERGGFGSSAQTYGMTGGQWTKGPAPEPEELAEATVTTEDITESPEGTPETAAEAEATDAAAEAADSSESSAGESASGSEGSASSDAGSGGDSGGSSGDGGGGGGDGGGGGGGE